MSTPAASGEPQLTRYEQELLEGAGLERGYVPADDLAEPSHGPSDPASASAPVGDKDAGALPSSPQAEQTLPAG
jgi:hypothetical protein